MGNRLHFTVPGSPVPCERARTFYSEKLGRVLSATPDRTKKYQKHVGLHGKVAANLGGWRIVDGSVYAIRIRVFREAKRGDLDNFVKSITDGLKGIVWDDDRHLVEIDARMFVDREKPRVEVTVEQRPEGDVETGSQRNLFGAA